MRVKWWQILSDCSRGKHRDSAESCWVFSGIALSYMHYILLLFIFMTMSEKNIKSAESFFVTKVLVVQNWLIAVSDSAESPSEEVNWNWIRK